MWTSEARRAMVREKGRGSAYSEKTKQTAKGRSEAGWWEAGRQAVRAAASYATRSLLASDTSPSYAHAERVAVCTHYPPSCMQATHKRKRPPNLAVARSTSRAAEGDGQPSNAQAVHSASVDSWE